MHLAAEQGQGEALKNLGHLYWKGLEPLEEKDNKKALMYLSASKGAGYDAPESWIVKLRSQVKEDVLNEIEGVTEERSHQVEEDKLESGKLPAIFDGTLDRDAMAHALNAVMTENGLSIRKAADAADVSRTDIERISKGSATLDKSADVLRNLGYELHVEVRKLDEP